MLLTLGFVVENYQQGQRAATRCGRSGLPEMMTWVFDVAGTDKRSKTDQSIAFIIAGDML